MNNKIIVSIIGIVVIASFAMGKRIKDISSIFKPIYDIPKGLQSVISQTPKSGSLDTHNRVSEQFVDMATITGQKSDQGINYLDQHHDTRDTGGGLKIVRGGGYAYTDSGNKIYANQSVLDKAKNAWNEFYS